MSSAIFCLTSKMSHARGRRGSCWFRLMSPCVHSIPRTLAGDVTDVGVGSGALLGGVGSLTTDISKTNFGMRTIRDCSLLLRGYSGKSHSRLPGFCLDAYTY